MTTISRDRSSYSANAEYWTLIIRDGLDRYRTGLTNTAMLEAAGDVTGLSVLDAGCGEGYLARMTVVMTCHRRVHHNRHRSWSTPSSSRPRSEADHVMTCPLSV